MSDHNSPPPSDPGAKQDSEESTIGSSLSKVDMLALALGMLEVAPPEDKTKQIEVSFA